MHSAAFATILAAAATLTSAAPSVNRRGAYYVCFNNGFRGDCSVDPCAISWCPDYKPYTYEPASATVPAPQPPVINPTPAAKAYYVCANNGFRGDCTVDPCAIAWCPDYTPYTYTPKTTKREAAAQSDPTVCAPGTGYFQSCSNGFRGCCKGDACGSTWCPDVKPAAKRDPAPQSDPTVCAPGTGYFQSCSNGFRGCCKGDACGSTWCPDAKPVSAVKRTPEPVAAPAPASDPTVCAAGTGYFQSCANGFRGCCKSDACASNWCADYKPFTYEAVGAASAPAPAAQPQTPAPAAPAGGDPTVCAPNTGFYQVCASGFKGCCKKDACSLGYCPL